MEIEDENQAGPQPQSFSSSSHDNSPVIQLLNQGDQLTQRFQKYFNESLTLVEMVNSATQQHENLSNLMSRTPGEDPGSPYPSVRQKTLAALSQTIDNGSAGIRHALNGMEETVDALSELLYRVDIYLAEPTATASIGFDPRHALNHLSSLFSAYQAELLAKRELFSSFNCEEISSQEFLQQWKICSEIKSLTQETFDDLADVMGAWSA